MKQAKGLEIEDILVGEGPVAVQKDIVHVHCICTRPKGDVVFDTQYQIVQSALFREAEKNRYERAQKKGRTNAALWFST